MEDSILPATGFVRTAIDITPPPKESDSEVRSIKVSITPIVYPALPTITPKVTAVSPCTTSQLYTSSSKNSTAISTCQMIELRSRDLLLAAYNVHNILIAILNGDIRPGGINRINDLNNDLWDLWLRIAGYGLGTDPVLNHRIMASSSGFNDAYPSPDYGVSGSFRTTGIPRLYEQLLTYTSLSAPEQQSRKAIFFVLVKPYANPEVYPHKEFFERAYSNYREGELLDTPQFAEDLKMLDAWLTDLEKVLGQIPGYLNL